MASNGVGLCRSARARATVAVLALMVGVLVSTGAFAQDEPQFDLQLFHPAVGPYSIFSVETSPVLGHLEPTGALVLNYGSRPLVLQPAGGGADQGYVDQQLAMHLMAGVGILNRGEIDMEVPVYLVDDSDFKDTSIQNGVVGDVAIRPKVLILSHDNYPVGLSGALDMTFPTGRQEALVGSNSVTVAPKVIADYQYQNVTFAANLGLRILQDTTVRNVKVGDRFEYGVGAEATLLKGLLRLDGELYGHALVSSPFGSKAESPMEGLLGAKVITRRGFSIFAGAGGGLVGGLGATEFRGFVGLRYADLQQDIDKDGIRDTDDKCPEEAEDLDGFQDEDGCPDVDNDADGVPDLQDCCAMKPGDAANQGCPVEKKDKQEDKKAAPAQKPADKPAEQPTKKPAEQPEGGTSDKAAPDSKESGDQAKDDKAKDEKAKDDKAASKKAADAKAPDKKAADKKAADDAPPAAKTAK